MTQQSHAPFLKIIVLLGLMLAGLLVSGLGISLAAGLAQRPSIYLQTQEKARAYSGPGEQYPLLAIYTQGITLTVSGRTDDTAWLQVDLSPYHKAWMKSGDLAVKDGDITGLAIAPTPAGLATSTPEVRPPVAIILGPAIGNVAGSKSAPGILIRVVTAIPHTKVSIVILNPAGKPLRNMPCSTDDQGICEVRYSTQIMTRGTYTVQATDPAGNVAEAQITLDWGKEPTPTPSKKK